MSRQASIGVSAPRPGSKTPGYSNLLSHTRQKHPDFEAIMVASDTGNQYPSLSDCLSATQPSCKTQSSRLPVYLLCAARASHCPPDNAACFNLLNRGTEATESVTAMSFAERVLKRSKEECQGRIEIPLLPFIPPISNCVKRFFSRAKHLLFHHHSRMLPIHLEMLLFLNENRHFWTANTSHLTNAFIAMQLFHPLVATFALLSFGTLAKVQEETKSIDDLYAEAVAEGGKLVLYHGGDTPTQQDSLHEDFQQRFQEINFTLVVDYSKYHDVRIDNQLETDTLVPDVVALQTLQDFTRWADEGKLLQYKPKWFSHIHASLKDNDGAWMAYTVYSFYTSYNSSSLDGLDAPATLENLTDSQWAGKIASSYPNDDDAVLYLSSNT
ncbi:hypothetical protein PC120_g16570 [Phytophthora cactorum]|nr:hypothetical protein PC120_g16570 [Phytophthora cactorum]